ncbi:MAG: bifunctional adenosylcobinamide kinase/adenosylcobinamide-phosphate guanylyltransferase [Roseobacter sp.]
MLQKLTFVLGGAASGKSRWAEKLLLSSRLDPVYLATARVLDSEINLKIGLHKKRRSARWTNYEADLELNGVLHGLKPTQAVLIDCATMWLSNHMLDDRDVTLAQKSLLAAMKACPAPIVIVSNEVGHGIVPQNALARAFREAQGRLNIALAEQSDLAVLVTAGLPLALKGELP